MKKIPKPKKAKAMSAPFKMKSGKGKVMKGPKMADADFGGKRKKKGMF